MAWPEAAAESTNGPRHGPGRGRGRGPRVLRPGHAVGDSAPPRAVRRGPGRRGQLKPAMLATVRPAERTRQARRCGAIETEMTCTASVAVYWTVQSSPLRGPHRGSRDTQSGCSAGSCAYRHRHGPGASASPLQGVQAGVRKHESGHRTGPIGTIEVNAQRAKPCFPLRFSDASSSA